MASFLRVKADLPDFIDLVTCDVAGDELLELPSPPFGSGGPPGGPAPPPKLGVVPLPFFYDTCSGLDPIGENSGTVAHRVAQDWAA